MAVWQRGHEMLCAYDHVDPCVVPVCPKLTKPVWPAKFGTCDQSGHAVTAEAKKAAEEEAAANKAAQEETSAKRAKRDAAAAAEMAAEEEPANEPSVAPIDRPTAAPFDKADTDTDGELSRAEYDVARADASNAVTADATVEAPDGITFI